MATGELNLQLSPTSPQARASAPEGPELPPLPTALETVGKNLINALAEDQQVAQAFATFCSAAYVKPDWAGAASDFLAELFAAHEDLLAELARIPDLIIELASGHVTLTCMVAARWAARGETHRLARLAEALIATQSKMCGTTAVVEVMLALATSLAITRYSRAEQLLNAAEPQAAEDQQEALAEAHLWLAAGRIVRGSSQEVRDLWDQRLRRSRQAWTWESPDEREALAQLANHVGEDPQGLSLFEPVIPSAWWDLALRLAKDRIEPEVPAPKAPPTSHLRLPPSVAAEHGHEHYYVHHPAPWNPRTFVAGTILGAMSLTCFIWLAQPRWIAQNPPPLSGLTKRIVGVSLRPPAPRASHAPASVAPKSEPESDAATSSPAPTPAEQGTGEPTTTPATTEAVPTPNPDAPPAPAESTAAMPASTDVPEVSHAQWRADSLDDLSKEEPDLAPFALAAKNGTWTQNETVLKGDSITAPRSSPSYQKLLLWLHLDPPKDPELRAKIPSLLVDLRADEPVLDLWKKLVYEGSPNATEIRNAAKHQLESNAETWSTEQQETLKVIAGSDMTPSQSATFPVPDLPERANSD